MYRYNLRMKRVSNKKPIERRKKARGSNKLASSLRAAVSTKEMCQSCSKDLRGAERALFVEEEIGRIFCSEACIANYFSPEVARLEKEYFKRLSPRDLSNDERQSLAHLRWITLQEPDEIWREKTLTGDYRYTLISEFQPESKRIWCICICLFLRNEPSFLYLAFATRNAAMANLYRKGERVQLKEGEPSTARQSMATTAVSAEELSSKAIDGLADEWTEEETIRAQLKKERRSDDIPNNEFELYNMYVEKTLSDPDEVWSLKKKNESTLKVFHFIRYCVDEDPGTWYIIVARETEDAEEIEILESFPTRDSKLVENYRRDHQELGRAHSNDSIQHQVH